MDAIHVLTQSACNAIKTLASVKSADAGAAKDALDVIGAELAHAMYAVADEAQIAVATQRRRPGRPPTTRDQRAARAQTEPMWVAAVLDALRGAPRTLDTALAKACGLRREVLEETAGMLVRQGRLERIHCPDGLLRYRTL